MQFTKKAALYGAATLAALGLAAGQASHAQTYTTPGQAIQDGWKVGDTRTNGEVNIVSTPTEDTDGSLQLYTSSNDSQSKAEIYHPANVSAASGITMSFDNYNATTTPSYTPAFRITVGSDQLVWEGAYNATTSVLNSWQNLDVGAGKFWLYDPSETSQAGNHNFDDDTNFYSLADWFGGNINVSDSNANFNVNLSSATITGYSIGFGSGIGPYNGYVDNVNFNGHTTDFKVAAAPEPSSVAAFAFTGLGALGLMFKARKRKALDA